MTRGEKFDQKLREMRDKQEPDQCYTLEEISQETGYTRERIRYIEKQALKKLHGLCNQLLTQEHFEKML